MIALIRMFFWFALFVVATLGFVTLFEHGWQDPQTFVKNVGVEVDSARSLYSKPIPRKKDESDKIGR